MIFPTWHVLHFPTPPFEGCLPIYRTDTKVGILWRAPGSEPVSDGGGFRKEADSWAFRVSGKLINTHHA